MTDMVTISQKEYADLIKAREDLEDLRAVRAHEADPQAGLPLELTKRLIDGENPLLVYREWRGLTQSALAEASGVNRVQIVQIEKGQKTGSAPTLKKLAGALGVAVDDLI